MNRLYDRNEYLKKSAVTLVQAALYYQKANYESKDLDRPLIEHDIVEVAMNIIEQTEDDALIEAFCTYVFTKFEEQLSEIADDTLDYIEDVLKRTKMED